MAATMQTALAMLLRLPCWVGSCGKADLQIPLAEAAGKPIPAQHRHDGPARTTKRRARTKKETRHEFSDRVVPQKIGRLRVCR